MIALLKSPGRTTRSVRLALTAAAGALALGIASVSFYFAARRAPLEAAPEAAGAEDALPVASARAVTMFFPDGSELALIAGARGKLARMSERGAHVILHDGEARVSIAPRPGAAWAIEAGPFSVVTGGAKLELSFSLADEELVVRALEGSATVHGPASPQGGTSLGAGQELITTRHRASPPRASSSHQPW